MTHKSLWLGGGLAQWGPLITTSRHPGAGFVSSVIFSRNSSQLASLMSGDARFWDSTSGTPISASNLEGDGIALASDFSVIALPRDATVKLYNLATNIPVATFAHSAKVLKVALSHDGSELAVALSNDTINLWDVQRHELISMLDSQPAEQLTFSPMNCVLASLARGEIRLWNGFNGEFIACLERKSEQHVRFLFSQDGSRLVSLTKEGNVWGLTLWSGEDGNFIGAAKGVGDVHNLAVSEDGSFLAAASRDAVELWSGFGDPLTRIDKINITKKVSLAFSRDLLGMASYYDCTVMLYDLRNQEIISTHQLSWPVSLAISPDCTRLAAGSHKGEVHLLDVAGIKTSNRASSKPPMRITALAFSPDSSRLASGFEDGTIELWNTDQAGQAIASHKLHSQSITGLEFSPDGEQLASGSWDKTVRVWDGKNGSTTAIIEHKFTDRVSSVAFSSGLLVAATPKDVTIWDRKTLHPIDAINLNNLSLPFSEVFNVLLAFSKSGSLLAIACRDYSSMTSSVAIWNIEERTVIAPPLKVESSVRNLTLSPDGSQLFVEKYDGHFGFFDISTGETVERTGDSGWIPRFDGIPISWNSGGNHLTGRFSEKCSCIPLLYFPTEARISSVAVRPSMFAVGCRDDRILLVRS